MGNWGGSNLLLSDSQNPAKTINANVGLWESDIPRSAHTCRVSDTGIPSRYVGLSESDMGKFITSSPPPSSSSFYFHFLHFHFHLHLFLPPTPWHLGPPLSPPLIVSSFIILLVPTFYIILFRVLYCIYFYYHHPTTILPPPPPLFFR